MRVIINSVKNFFKKIYYFNIDAPDAQVSLLTETETEAKSDYIFQLEDAKKHILPTSENLNFNMVFTSHLAIITTLLSMLGYSNRCLNHGGDRESIWNLYLVNKALNTLIVLNFPEAYREFESNVLTFQAYNPKRSGKGKKIIYLGRKCAIWESLELKIKLMEFITQYQLYNDNKTLTDLRLLQPRRLYCPYRLRLVHDTENSLLRKAKITNSAMYKRCGERNYYLLVHIMPILSNFITLISDVGMLLGSFYDNNNILIPLTVVFCLSILLSSLFMYALLFEKKDKIFCDYLPKSNSILYEAKNPIEKQLSLISSNEEMIKLVRYMAVPRGRSLLEKKPMIRWLEEIQKNTPHETRLLSIADWANNHFQQIAGAERKTLLSNQLKKEPQNLTVIQDLLIRMLIYLTHFDPDLGNILSELAMPYTPLGEFKNQPDEDKTLSGTSAQAESKKNSLRNDESLTIHFSGNRTTPKAPNSPNSSRLMNSNSFSFSVSSSSSASSSSSSFGNF